MSNSNDMVYTTIISNKLAMKKLALWEKRLLTHEKRVAKAKAVTAKQDVKAAKKTTDTKSKELNKQQRVEKAAYQTKQRLLLKEEKKVRDMESAKRKIFRSTMFYKLNLDEKMALKAKLSQAKTLEDVRETNARIVASERRKSLQIAAIRKKQSAVGSGGMSVATKGGMAGGLVGTVATLASNPAVLAAAAAAAASIGLIAAGAGQYKEIKQGGALTGMSFNKMARESAGFAAISDKSAADLANGVFKDINDRSGEFLNEATFDKESGTYSGGEGSIMANLLMQQGKSREEVESMMQLDPADFTKAIAKALQGQDIKTITFATEAFSSEMANLVLGYQQNRATYEQAKAGAVTFSGNEAEAADKFNLALINLGATLQQIPLNVFKSFTSALSPSTLEMFDTLGSILSKVFSVFGDVLAVTLNVLSLALNPLLNIIDALLTPVKALFDYFAEGVKVVTTFGDKIQNLITDMFKNIFDGILSVIPDWALPEEVVAEREAKAKAEAEAKAKKEAEIIVDPVVKPLPNPIYGNKGSAGYNPYNILPNPTTPQQATTQATTPVTPISITVQSILDGNVVAESVAESAIFDGAVDRKLQAGFIGSR